MVISNPNFNYYKTEISILARQFQEATGREDYDKLHDLYIELKDLYDNAFNDDELSRKEKITIGEIFKQLALDSGYIMGRILEAGYQGYEKNMKQALKRP